MLKKSILLLSFFYSSFLYAQNTNDTIVVTEKMRKEYRKNQHLLDANHCGIGITSYKPNFGNITTIDEPWVGVNILSDILEIKFGFGKAHVRGTIPYGFSYTQDIDEKQFGKQFSIGGNFPLNFLTIGSQKSATRVFRGHPVLSVEFGYFSLTNQLRYAGKSNASIAYMGVNPGYRIRFPYGSFEVNLNTRLGLTTGESGDYYKGSGIYPSFTVRLDGLKWLYDGDIVSVPMSQTSLSNVQSTTRHTGTNYTQTGRVDYYTTYTTADVHVSTGTVGVQDIGTHIGIGPKYSFMNNKREPYIPLSTMFGVVAEGRSGLFDFGLTFEGGKIGHGGKLESIDVKEGTYKRKLDKRFQSGQGQLNTVNLYANVGIDITSVFLIPFGILIDKGNATSFFCITGGLNLGGQLVSNQKFYDTSMNTYYQNELIKDNGRAKAHYIDPGKAKSGFLGGYYLSIQAGALAFKFTNYRYRGAPFASTNMYSIAYRYPLRRR